MSQEGRRKVSQEGGRKVSQEGGRKSSVQSEMESSPVVLKRNGTRLSREEGGGTAKGGQRVLLSTRVLCMCMCTVVCVCVCVCEGERALLVAPMSIMNAVFVFLVTTDPEKSSVTD